MAGPRILFHLGRHKTGTSSLQNLMHSNRAVLADRGVLYPLSGLRDQPWIGCRHNGLVYNTPARVAQAHAALIDEIRASGCEQVVLSCEGWSLPANHHALTLLIRRLQDAGLTDLSGLLVLRNSTRFAVSFYREFIMNQGTTDPFARVLKATDGRFDPLYVVDQLQRSFDGRLTLMRFEDHDDIVPALFAAGQIDGAGLTPLAARVNARATGALEVEVTRHMNKIGVPDPQRANVVAAAQDIWGGQEWTERFDGDLPAAQAAYQARLQAVTGWSGKEASSLLDVPAIVGDPISDISGKIRRHVRQAAGGH